MKRRTVRYVIGGILVLGVAPARVLETISTSVAKMNPPPATPSTLTADAVAARALRAGAQDLKHVHAN